VSENFNILPHPVLSLIHDAADRAGDVFSICDECIRLFLATLPTDKTYIFQSLIDLCVKTTLCCLSCSVVEVLTQLNQVQRPRSHHRPSSLQLLGIASKSSTKPLHHTGSTGSGGSSSKSTFTFPSSINNSRCYF